MEHVGLVPLALLDQLSECVAVGVGRAHRLDTLGVQPLDEAAARLVIQWGHRRSTDGGMSHVWVDCIDTLQPLDEAAAGLRGTGEAQMQVWDRRRQGEVLLVSMGGKYIGAFP